MDRLGIALKLAERNKWKAAVVFVDLDNYKIINDTFGHPAGDQILKLVALRMAGAKNVGKYQSHGCQTVAG
jgi:diguanylate cyclase (GGDEF)-like protein